MATNVAKPGTSKSTATDGNLDSLEIMRAERQAQYLKLLELKARQAIVQDRREVRRYVQRAERIASDLEALLLEAMLPEQELYDALLPVVKQSVDQLQARLDAAQSTSTSRPL